MEAKQCKTCLLNLPLTEFGVRERGRLGRKAHCFSCGREKASQSRSQPRPIFKSFDKRLEGKIDFLANGCHQWTGSKHKCGSGFYPELRYGPRQLGTVHRDILRHRFGPIPDHLLACHKCGNSLCVNPEHIYLGTAKDNAQDMVAHGRAGRADAFKVTQPRRKLIVALRNLGVKGAVLAKIYGVSQSSIASCYRKYR